MLPKPEQLLPWLNYEDIHPPSGPKVLIQGAGRESQGNSHEVGWLHESWLAECALVAQRKAKAAFVADSGGRFYLSASWRDEANFDFGERVTDDGFVAEAFVFQRAHPVSQTPIVELRQDYLRYHMLDRPSPEVYVHPRMKAEVAWTEVPEHPDKKANVLLQLDFLRDYLAARRRCMIIRLTMDRFANVPDASALGVKASDRTCIAPGEQRQVDVFRDSGQGDYWLIRSILWRSFMIKPYDRPKAERNPWYIHLDTPVPTSYEFHLDEHGNKGALTTRDCPPYLHFRREVLRHYLETEGFYVGFHMRKWGAAGNPQGQSIDVGVNPEGQVTAFAPDIAKLPAEQQAHWAHHSCFPNGSVCPELFQTRMMCDPPHSPNVVDMVRAATDAFASAMARVTGGQLYHGSEPSDRDLCALTVGPLLDGPDLAEISRLSKVLYQIVVEALSIKVLRAAAKGATPPKGEKWGSIRWLQELLVQQLGYEEKDAAAAMTPLRDLNELRQADAHAKAIAIENICASYGVPIPPRTFCVLWDAIVDRTVFCLQDIGEAIA